MNTDTKDCPDCAETVRAKARKCKHCGYEFAPVFPAVNPTQVQAPVPAEQVVNLLFQLVNKNLVVYEEQDDGSSRYRLLETVRQYSREKLTENGEGEQTRKRHRDYFVTFAERFNLPQLEADFDNLRTALNWCLAEPHGAQPGLRLVAALRAFWGILGYVEEGLTYSAAVLTRDEAQEPTPVRAGVLDCAGELARMQGDYEKARLFLEESVALHRTLGQPEPLSLALNTLGWLESVEGHYQRAQALHEEALAISRAQHITWVEAFSLTLLGVAARYQENYTRARRFLEESEVRWRVAGHKSGLALTQVSHGQVALAEGNQEAAHALVNESLRLCQEVGDKRVAVMALERCAALAWAQKRAERAGRLWGASQALGERISYLLPARDRAEYEQVLTEQALSDNTTFAAVWAEGRAMSFEQAVTYALADRE